MCEQGWGIPMGASASGLISSGREGFRFGGYTLLTSALSLGSTEPL